jgi:hypothetical protein
LRTGERYAETGEHYGCKHSVTKIHAPSSEFD